MTEEKQIDLHERLLFQTILSKLERIEQNQLLHGEKIAALRERVAIFSSIFGAVGGILTAVATMLIKGK